jgi:hypothetical protein
MDRLSRVLAGSLAMLLVAVSAASGCRSMRSEVPPGKPYSTTGGQPPVGFSSDAHPKTGVGPGMYQGGLNASNASPDGNQTFNASNGMNPQLGVPAPNSANYGQPTPNKYGAVGSNNGTGP